jgi:hypothetical protein
LRSGVTDRVAAELTPRTRFARDACESLQVEAGASVACGRSEDLRYVRRGSRVARPTALSVLAGARSPTFIASNAARVALYSSERRPHLGGALGAAVLDAARRRRWVVQDLDSRILRVTAAGRREMGSRLELDLSR